MTPDFNVSEVDYQSLSPDAKERYVFKTIEKLLHENQDGITKSEIQDQTPFGRKTIDKHIERLVALNEAYVRRMGGTDVFYPNGRLLHSNAEWKAEFDGKTFKLTLLENISGQSIYIQDIEEDAYGESAKGGILLPREHFDQFLHWLEDVSMDMEEYDE
jgi:hypothetical protein